MQLTRQACNQWNENIIDEVYQSFKLLYLKYLKYLKSERKFGIGIPKKCDEIFSDPESDHIF